ncbi:MAG: hypothetical protein V4449_02540 [Patescibacteria group bacterium]
MKTPHTHKAKKPEKKIHFLGILGISAGSLLLLYLVGFINISNTTYSALEADAETVTTPAKKPKVLDKVAYDAKLIQIANYASSTLALRTASSSPLLWPPKTVYPNAEAILPFKRIVAYYGNFYSKGMGVLGEYPKSEMIQKLKAEVAVWNAADPTTPVVPAINYIAITAQGSAGKDGKYRLRMPDTQIDYALELAKEVEGIVILDVQVGLSNLQTELPIYENYFKMPQVHLGIDPEFAMHNGVRPGRVIGSFDASDINYAINYLSKLVKDNNLPPKVLVVHRFTEDMVTNYKQIKPTPEVQVIMDMDGWGFGAKKFNTYNTVIYPEPVQFTGFKLFYKNDLKPPSTRMLTPAEILELTPQPLFIQYQ